MSNLLVHWEVLHSFFSVPMEILNSIPDPGLLVQETDQFGQKMVHMEEKDQNSGHFLPDFSKCGTYTIYRRTP